MNASCHDANTASIVSGLCAGKNSCTFTANDPTFKDPCPLVLKRFAAKVKCKANTPTHVFDYDITVPVGSTGSVVLPTFGAATSSVQITESGSAVWAKGAFVAGVAGVTGAASEHDATGDNIRITVGSGDYHFAVLA